jgi:hypothetical protein
VILFAYYVRVGVGSIRRVPVQSPVRWVPVQSPVRCCQWSRAAGAGVLRPRRRRQYRPASYSQAESKSADNERNWVSARAGARAFTLYFSQTMIGCGRYLNPRLGTKHQSRVEHSDSLMSISVANPTSEDFGWAKKSRLLVSFDQASKKRKADTQNRESGQGPTPRPADHHQLLNPDRSSFGEPHRGSAVCRFWLF